MESRNTIKERYNQIVGRIRIAMGNSGRQKGDIRLVVVTKGQPRAALLEVIRAGATDIGENYVQEAVEKIAALPEPKPTAVDWHMIGHVQSRKAAKVVETFSWVHSIDSLKLSNRLNRYAEERGMRLKVLLEYNVSGEATKFGWDASRPENWPGLAREVEEIIRLEFLDICGLMTMAPYAAEAELSRPFFRRLRKLSEHFQQQFGLEHFQELSMGMSQDFEIAIEEGATILRIGEAIMGPRPVN